MSWNSYRGIRMGFSYMGAYHKAEKSKIPSSLYKYFKILPTKECITIKPTLARKAKPLVVCFSCRLLGHYKTLRLRERI